MPRWEGWIVLLATSCDRASAALKAALGEHSGRRRLLIATSAGRVPLPRRWLAGTNPRDSSPRGASAPGSPARAPSPEILVLGPGGASGGRLRRGILPPWHAALLERRIAPA